MKTKKPKAVLAWASLEDGRIDVNLLYARRCDAVYFSCDYDDVVKVRIVPVTRKTARKREEKK